MKKCRHCGKEFTAIVHNKNYCSEECKRVVAVAKAKSKRKQPKKIKNLSIYEIVRRATAEGLTYGEYVAKYNL